MVRYWCTIIANNFFGSDFPWGTIIVNVIGSFVIGFVAALVFTGKPVVISPNIQKFIMVGICGGYTTFSSFSFDTLTLLQRGEYFKAGSNVTLSVMLSLLAVYSGFTIINSLAHSK